MTADRAKAKLGDPSWFLQCKHTYTVSIKSKPRFFAISFKNVTYFHQIWQAVAAVNAEQWD